MSDLSRQALSGSLTVFDQASCLQNRLISFALSWIPFTARKLRVNSPAKDSAILITGTSSGIGKDLALHLAHLGYTVFATVRQERAGEALKEAAISKGVKARLRPTLLDVTEMDKLEGVIQDILRQCTEDGLALVALINNAGIGHSLPVELTPASQLEEIMRTNFLGPAEITRLLLPTLRQCQGRIINMGSLAGIVNPPWYGAYSGSKAAVFAWNDVLRREMAPFGVGVSILEPGVIASPGPAKVQDRMMSNMKEGGVGGAVYSSKGHQHMLGMAPVVCLPTKHVTDAVVDALLSPWPKARYIIGWDARLIIFLARCFGNRLIDPVTASIFHFFGSPYSESMTQVGQTGLVWSLAILGVMIMWCLIKLDL